MGLSFAVLVALGILIVLGTWQARKAGPKTALLKKIEVGLSATPMALPVHLDDPSSVEYQRFSVVGRFLDKPPLAVFATNTEGKGGYHLYMPLKSQYGRIVMVNLGWVPNKDQLESYIPPETDLNITGVLRANSQPGAFSAPNVISTNDFYTADVHDLAASWGFTSKDYYHFRLASDHRGELGTLPQGGQIRLDIPNNHFQYALTWFGIGLSLVGVYIAVGIKKARDEA